MLHPKISIMMYVFAMFTVLVKWYVLVEDLNSTVYIVTDIQCSSLVYC